MGALTPKLIPETIPDRMRDLPHWVVWRYVTRDGKPTKVPHNPRNGALAKSNDPDTWGTFADACMALERGRWEGVGFQFSGSGLTGVDFDHKQWGEGVHPLAAEALETLDTYSEMTPSGKGQHAILDGQLPEWATNRKAIADDLEVEVYSSGRFFTVTGQVIQSPFIEARQEALEALLIRWGMVKAVPLTREASTGSAGSFTGSDSELWERIWRSTNGQAVRALADGDLTQYGGDRSRADFALCGHLCFWTNGDAGRMDAMFRTSGLMRPKWDAKHRSDGTTYGQMTIQEVLTRWDGVGYDPARKEPTKPTITADWKQPDVLLKGRQYLASGGSHGRTVNSYSTLWQSVVHVITSGHTTQDGGTLTFTTYGMTELYAHAGGRPVDRRQQLGFLKEQGMCGPLIRQEPSNPRSAWLLTVPANPAELPFMADARRSLLARLPVSSKPRQGTPYSSTKSLVNNYYERENRVCGGGKGFSAFWTLFALSVLREGKITEIADLARVSHDRAYRHLRTLPTIAVQTGRQWAAVLTPEEVGALYLHITAPEVAHRRKRMLEDRRRFHENKFEYLTSRGLHSQAALHFQYAEKYRKHLEAA